MWTNGCILVANHATHYVDLACNRADDASLEIAGSGASFDNQVAFLCQRLFNGLGHLQLSTAELVRGMSLREHPPRRKEVMERCGLFLG